MPRLYIGNREVTPAIVKGSAINNQDKTITENGVYTADEGYTGLGEVTVEVSPEITELNVTPTTSAQIIVAPAGTDGYSPVNVAAVTSSIDSNIIAGNIKKDVQILGVTGTVEELNGETKVITPTTSQQVITPSSGKNAITQATVEAVTSSIDANIIAGNIKKDVTILGVTGTLESGGINIPREVTNGTYHIPTNISTFSLPSDVTNVYDYALNYAFRSCQSLTSVDLSGLTTISGYNALSHAFEYCQSLTSVNLSNLVDISGGSALDNAFHACSKLTSLDLSSLTTVSGNSAMYYAFNGCSRLTSIDLSSLTTLGTAAMYYAFQGCTSLTSVNLPSLTAMSNINAMHYAFQGCTSLTSVDLSSLITISGDQAMYFTFQGCTNLTSVDLSSLTTISGSASMRNVFQNCTSLTSVDLSSLTTLSGSGAMYYAFSNCTSLTTLSFPALTSTSFGSYTNQFNNMLQGVTGCTVHFPSNLQTVIGSWSDVTAGFGGTNTTILFDLPATE